MKVVHADYNQHDLKMNAIELCDDGNDRFTTIPMKALSDQV